MTNRLADVDTLVDQIDQRLLQARLAKVGVGSIDEQAMLDLALDSLDTAGPIAEAAVAVADAAGALSDVDRRPANLRAGVFRSELARELTESSAANDEAAALLRSIGSGLAQIVQSGRERAAKLKANRETDALNRDLLRRLRDVNGPSVEERLRELAGHQFVGEPGFADRQAQREHAARREAVEYGR